MANAYFANLERLLREIRVNAVMMFRLGQITRHQFNDQIFRCNLAEIQLRNRRTAYNNYMTRHRHAANNQNSTRNVRQARSARSRT